MNVASLHLVKYTCTGKWKIRKYTFLLLFSLSPKILHIPSFFGHLFHIRMHMHLLEIYQNIKCQNLEEGKDRKQTDSGCFNIYNGKGTTRHMNKRGDSRIV